VVLWVFEENHRARSFYESAGFALEPDSRKLIEIGGSRYPEVRYRRSMPGVATGDQT
jgi:RimJ/RimL family protein N-acetyltransferase